MTRAAITFKSCSRLFINSPFVSRTTSSIFSNTISCVHSFSRPTVAVTTRSSLESVFREELDDLFVLSRDGSLVRANELPFAKEGDVSNWLVSDVFGGIGGRSREAKLLIDTAMHFMAKRVAEAETSLQMYLAMMNDLPVGELSWLKTVADEHRPLVERIHEALKNTLPGHDEFWVRESAFAALAGVVQKRDKVSTNYPPILTRPCGRTSASSNAAMASVAFDARFPFLCTVNNLANAWGPSFF